MAGNHHNMTSGHLKCNNSLIWLQNLQKCEMSKNHIFLQVRGHRKLQFFWISQKPLKWLEIIIIWHQDTSNVIIHSFGCKICKSVKMSKNHIFLQVRGHRKLQFFWISQKPLKWLEIIIIWHQDTSNVIIHSFGCKICKSVKCPKITFFSRSAVIENFNFFEFLKSP